MKIVYARFTKLLPDPRKAVKLNRRTGRITNRTTQQTTADFFLYIGRYYCHISLLHGRYCVPGPGINVDAMIANRFEYHLPSDF